MRTVGCLGDIAFEVSTKTLMTLNNFVWSGSVRFSEHQRVGTNALTEFAGIDADHISFDIILSAYLGVNPLQEMIKIWEHERNGDTLPLVVGNKAYGKYRWCITDHQIKSQSFDGDGDITSATVSISLLEYLRS